MRLDQALVQRNLCESRQEAQEAIALGYVSVDGVVTTKQTKQIEDTMTIELSQKRKFVSRGGDKLEGALVHIFKGKEQAKGILEGKHALDVGSSTGGFTDCLLSYGVRQVVAIDVGTAQLHSRLRTDSRVILFENTDIRDVTREDSFDIVVADLSFIPLERVIDTIFAFGTKKAHYFILIKPQFEVGKGNTKKGIVKNQDKIQEVLQKYTDMATTRGLQKVEVFPSIITGGDGNQEYFLFGTLQ